MTQLLERAFREAEMLSSADQDALAQHILEELNAERRWTALFEQTKDAQWDELARRVRCEVSAGEAEPLEDL